MNNLENFGLLKNLLNLHWKNHTIISENISNVNTPNYKRRKLDFQRKIKEAINKDKYKFVEGEIKKPKNTLVRINGNNVDIEKEMLDLGQNSKLYKMYTDIYSRKSQMISLAIGR